MLINKFHSNKVSLIKILLEFIHQLFKLNKIRIIKITTTLTIMHPLKIKWVMPKGKITTKYTHLLINISSKVNLLQMCLSTLQGDHQSFYLCNSSYRLRILTTRNPFSNSIRTSKCIHHNNINNNSTYPNINNTNSNLLKWMLLNTTIFTHVIPNLHHRTAQHPCMEWH